MTDEDEALSEFIAQFEAVREYARDAPNAQQRRLFERMAAMVLDTLAGRLGDKRPVLREIAWDFRADIASGAQFDRRPMQWRPR
jgi:hypothetical protein